MGGGQVAAAAGAVPGLAKSYIGSAHNTTASASGVLKLTGITQTGHAIAGTLTFESPLSGTGPFTGTISTAAVHFTAHVAGAVIVFTGKVWPIVSMDGSWVAHLSSGGSQVGTWGVGSTWNGSQHSITADATNHMAISQMTESANGAIIGALIITNFGSGTLTGSLHGITLKFTAPVACSTIKFVGTLSALGSMSGTWTYKYAPCNGVGINSQNGTWDVERAGAVSAI
jgi:hypothetical protein